MPAAAQSVGARFAPDHLGCVVDDATLTAVDQSAFLGSEFAHVAAGGAASLDGAPWSNRLIFGELTYVELINARAAAQLGVEVGDCMIALTSDVSGVLRELADSVSEDHPDWGPSYRLREMPRGPDSVPWYYTLDFAYPSGIGGLGLWLKEYHPEFKHRMSPELHPEVGDVSRRRDAPQVAHHPAKYFQDVTGVTVAVPVERRAQLEAALLMIGFGARRNASNVTWATDEFDIEFAPVTDPDDYAIREVRLNLTRPFTGANRTVELGSLRLAFPTDTSAILVFTRPTN